jgi:glycosyltransferase involved in cell wall biosynthesis
MKPLISVCMIVKNEEKVLRRCLESICGIADEIIVVDTGSSDKSKEIAHLYTNMVYDFKWEDDFSKARNFASSKASGEWIVAIDADEYVDRESFIKFKENLKVNSGDPDIFAVQIVNFIGNNGKDTVLNYHERIYKNDGSISFYRNIHEMLKHKDAIEKRAFAEFQIFHTGYMQNVVKEKDKSKRNLTLLKNKKEKEPVDYYFLGNEYYQLGELDNAINYYKKGYLLKKNINYDWVLKLLVRLISCLHDAKRNDEALEVINASEDVFPYIVDFKFLKGKIYFVEGNHRQAMMVFKEILSRKDELKADSSTDYLEYSPHRYMGELFESENEFQLAVHHYSKALSINDSDDYIWMKLLSLLADNATLEELTQFINNNCLTRSSMSPLRLIRILLSIRNREVQQLTRSFLNEPALSLEEKEALFLKNLILDGNNHEISNIINRKTENALAVLLSKGILNVVDLILLALDTNYGRYKTILYNLKFETPIVNLLDMLFSNKINELSSQEETVFISLLKQAHVLKLNKVIGYLNGKADKLGTEVEIKLNMSRI